jgi:hypothetical protein
MGIEWLDTDTKPLPPDITAPKSQSVQDLIDSVLKRSPGHVAVIESGVLHIYPAELASSKLNFLNLKIASYSVNEANLFEAEEDLQLAISATLYPEHYKNGYNGGYGYPPGDVFTIRNITFESQNVTVRELLSRITSQNGNSLWVVKLQPEEFRVKRPRWRHEPLDQYGSSPLASRWKFIPLSTLAELATEQFVVELTIEPFISAERLVIPVVPHYKLSDFPRMGGGSGLGSGSMEGGGTCLYGLTIKETRADGIVFSFNSTVELQGQPREAVNEEFTVTKAAIFENSYRPRVHIKAWFESRVATK